MSRNKRDGRHGGSHKKTHAFLKNIKWLKVQPRKMREKELKRSQKKYDEDDIQELIL
jgi:hypothetical protein